MPTLVCPACGRSNGGLVLSCEACGTRLHDEDTVPGVLLRSEPAAPPAAPDAHPGSLGALWLPDLEKSAGDELVVTVPAGLAPPVSPTANPAPPPRRRPREHTIPAPVPVTLRVDLDIDALAPPPTRAAGAASARAPAAAASSPSAPSGPSGPRAAMQKLIAAGRATGSAAKAAHRAAVRKARLGTATPAAAPGVAPEVLVLDPDDRGRAELHALLRAFGFNVSMTVDPRVAAALVTRRRFAACFVELALDGSDGGVGVEFCRALRRADQASGPARTLLVLLATRRDVTGEVRAQLAGCDAVIVKPAARGDVARAFESAGLALPADERRS